MKAYVIVQESIHDDEMFTAYRAQVLPTVQEFGGTFIVRGGTFTIVEGVGPQPRLVIIEFPSRVAAEGWYKSPGYQQLIPLRRQASTGNLIIVDGVP
mgnify:CR=1 FL=1